MSVPVFLFTVQSGDSTCFEQVEACVKEQLKGEDHCSFLKSAAFTLLRRTALYEAGNHNGGFAFTGHGLCVKLFPDNRVLVKWT